MNSDRESMLDRLENLLSGLMEETGIEMLLVLNREYAEEPVYFTLVPQPAHAARRTKMLVFHRRDDGSPDRLNVNRYPLGEPYQVGWSGGELDEQWRALGELIAGRDPQTIGINFSAHWPEADGLTRGLHRKLLTALPERLHDRLVSAEELVIRWFETRSEQELEVYPHMVALARSVLAEGFSSKVITLGVTTTDDLAWYLRERFEQRGLPIWFMPYVNIQRQGVECNPDMAFCGIEGVIRPGDVLHTDVGICYLKLCTDTQEMASVMKPGEEGVPAGLRHALSEDNRWQDLLAAAATGRVGRATRPYQTGAVGLLRRRKADLPRRATDSVASDSVDAPARNYPESFWHRMEIKNRLTLHDCGMTFIISLHTMIEGARDGSFCFACLRFVPGAGSGNGHGLMDARMGH